MGWWWLPAATFSTGFKLANLICQPGHIAFENVDLFPLTGDGFIEIVDCLILKGKTFFEFFDAGGERFCVGHEICPIFTGFVPVAVTLWKKRPPQKVKSHEEEHDQDGGAEAAGIQVAADHFAQREADEGGNDEDC